MLAMAGSARKNYCFGEDYEKCFDTGIYLRFYSGIDLDPIDVYLQKEWTQVFASGDIKGLKLLEFGCGPSINTVIPSSRCFDEIHMCEYAPQNRQAVQDWIDKKPSAHDWTSFLKFTAEKEGEGTTYQDVEARVRQKIKQVIPCDIHKENIFEPNQLEPESFDCVTSNLCLDAACATEADFKTAVQTLSTFLKPGGHIIMGGALYDSFYKVGDQVFCTLPIRPELLQDALEGAGFAHIKLDTLDIVSPDIQLADYTGAFFVKAIKKSSF